jgi:hypothetical protein
MDACFFTELLSGLTALLLFIERQEQAIYKNLIIIKRKLSKIKPLRFFLFMLGCCIMTLRLLVDHSIRWSFVAY